MISQTTSDEMKRLFILYGRPNSGKGELIKWLKALLNICTLGAGEVCRHHKDKETQIWKRASAWMSANDSTLWPTDILMEACMPRLDDCAVAHKTVVADGIVRKSDQNKPVLDYVKRHNFGEIVLIGVDTDENECIRRAEKRGRFDDKDMNRRLNEYTNETLPAVHELLSQRDLNVNHLILSGNKMMTDAKRFTLGIGFTFNVPLC